MQRSLGMYSHMLWVWWVCIFRWDGICWRLYIDYLIQLCKTENLIEEAHLDQNFHQVMLTSEGFIDTISNVLKEAFWQNSSFDMI